MDAQISLGHPKTLVGVQHFFSVFQGLAMQMQLFYLYLFELVQLNLYQEVIQELQLFESE